MSLQILMHRCKQVQFKEVLANRALEAQRQTELQRAYEPYQRVEFLKGIMTNLPTTQSTLTATTAPGANPVSTSSRCWTRCILCL